MKLNGRPLPAPWQIALGLALTVGLGAVLVVVHAALTELNIDFTPRIGPVPLPVDRALAGTTTVDVARAGEPRLAAFYQPPVNGRIIVLVHGTGTNRSQVLPEASILARHGYGVLCLDWPGHGESAGQVHWDEGERTALREALDYAAAAAGADGHALGIFGFSMGTWIALQVAVTDQRVQAMALGGAFADTAATITHDVAGRFGGLSAWGGLMAARLHGMRYWEARPVDLIGALAPRPVLIIAGTADHAVPYPMAEELYRAAREPKTLWAAEGAGHGGYAAALPVEYEQRLVGFFDGALHPLPYHEGPLPAHH